MSTQNASAGADGTALKKIADALKGLQFGSVLITVHNSRIVQIDRVEKTRFGREPGPIGEDT